MHLVAAHACRDRDILKSRLRADLRVYAEAIAALQQDAVTGLLENTNRGFQMARRNVKHAQLAYQYARWKLDEHLAAHGCE